jgi:NAD(P)-dependent dehydrogenase (short-subunit alcohol dehydrogenase family)
MRKQSVFVPEPKLTEKTLPDQTGRVSIITGGYAGVGLELSKMIYGKNGTVYIAGRSAEKAEKAIAAIKEANPSSAGKVEFLKVDLSDLTSIKPAVESFTSKESKLDVLINNAGVMFPPAGEKDKHGHDLQIGTNCLGPYLLTKLLTPTLESTAKDAPPSSVRVAWAGSIAVDVIAPKNGLTIDASGEFVAEKSNVTNYGGSKAGNYFLASQYAKHHPIAADGKGVVSTAFNPGNLKTELTRHTPVWQTVFLNPFLYTANYGAYTELFCGWSPEVTADKKGSYVWPWGRFGPVRKDVEQQNQAGGNAEKFWEWCDKETRTFA